MSIWSDIDVDSLPEDPFMIEEGWYRTRIVDVKVSFSKTGATSINLTGKIEYGQFKGLQLRKTLWQETKPAGEDGQFTHKQDMSNASTLKNLRDGFDMTMDEIKAMEDWTELNGHIVYMYNTRVPDRNDSEKIYNSVKKDLKSEAMFDRMMDEQDDKSSPSFSSNSSSSDKFDF